MVDNELINSAGLLGKKSLMKGLSSKSESSKYPEHLLVTYQIEKNSGFRTNKKSNSFRASPSTSLKNLVQTVIKKTKFCTRQKYIILYFDTEANKWKKFKDRSNWNGKSQVKLRVCRCKAQTNKGQEKSESTEKITGNGRDPGMNAQGQMFSPLAFNPGMAAYFYSYLCFCYFNRMNNMM